MPPLKADLQTLYETDYLRWIETTVKKLQSQDYTNVDWENLIEEIEDMGRGNWSSVIGNWSLVIAHTWDASKII